MTIIEIEDAETEAIIQEQLKSGDFESAQDVVRFALKAARKNVVSEPLIRRSWQEVVEEAKADGTYVPQPVRPDSPGRSFLEIFDELRAVTGGVDLDITRDPSPGRDVDLS